MRELINNREEMLTYLNSFSRYAPGMSEDMFQQSCLLALESPRPLSLTERYRLANEAAVATIRDEQRHHPRR